MSIFYVRVYRLIRVGWRDFAFFWDEFSVLLYRVRGDALQLSPVLCARSCLAAAARVSPR